MKKHNRIRVLIVCLSLFCTIIFWATLWVLHFVSGDDTADNGQCAAVLAQRQTLSSAKTQESIKLNDLPDRLQQITSSNASKLRVVEIIGRGYSIDNFRSSTDDLMVLTSRGLWKHDHRNLDAAPELLWEYSVGVARFVRSPDNTMLAIQTTSHPQIIPVWNVATGQTIWSFSANEQNLSSITFSPDSKLLAAALYGKVYLWDTTSGATLAILNEFTGFISQIAFSPDSKLLAASGNDNVGTPDQYNLREVTRIWKLDNLPKNTTSYLTINLSSDDLSFDTNSAYLRIGGVFNTGPWTYWEMHTGLQVQSSLIGAVKWVEITTPSKLPTDLEKYYAQNTIDNLEFVTDRSLIGTISDPLKTYPYLKSHPNGQNSVTFTSYPSFDATIRICDLATGKQVYAFSSAEFTTDVLYTPDGKLLVVSDGTGKINLIDTTNYKIIDTINSSSDKLAFNPDGTLLVATVANERSGDYSIRVWDFKNKKLLTTLYGHTREIRSIVFSNDSRLIASFGNDNTLRIWGIPFSK